MQWLASIYIVKNTLSQHFEKIYLKITHLLYKSTSLLKIFYFFYFLFYLFFFQEGVFHLLVLKVRKIHLENNQQKLISMVRRIFDKHCMEFGNFECPVILSCSVMRFRSSLPESSVLKTSQNSQENILCIYSASFGSPVEILKSNNFSSILQEN